jgi:nocardicin N-oxygenase
MRAFTGRRIEQMRPQIEEIVASLLDQVATAGPPADLRREFSEPLTVMVICDVLGVPLSDRELFRALTTATMAVGTGGPDGAAGKATSQFYLYMQGLVQAKRHKPATDLLSHLISASELEGQLSDDEVIWLGVALLIGGHETTLNQLNNSIISLLTRADQLALLRSRPGILRDAVEELLRFVPLNVGSAYAVVATEDVELDGVVIRAGEAVIPDIAVANRDPTVFQRPDDLDLTRGDVPHVSFGYGAHHCVGAQLARLELEVALSEVITRFPSLRLAVDEADLRWSTGSLIRGPRELPVCW